jgi:hypothetical protein
LNHANFGRYAGTTVDQFGMARMYSTLAENHADLDSNVFYSLAAADQWLTRRTTATELVMSPLARRIHRSICHS